MKAKFERFQKKILMLWLLPPPIV